MLVKTGWKIVEQEETVGRTMVSVRCKRVKCYLAEKNGEKHFGRLGFLLLQVVVKNGDRELKLKLNASNGVHNPKFIIQQPDKMVHQTVVIGEGKRKRLIPDVLAPMIAQKGEKEEFSNPERFLGRLSRLLGEELANEVMDLFAEKLSEIN